MEVTSGEGGKSGEQGTNRVSAEPIELGASKNRDKVLRERAEKEADLLSAASPRANSILRRLVSGSVRHMPSEVLSMRFMMRTRSVR
jgi:hypothetical protein